MEEIAKIVIEEFGKKPDGSWVCLKSSDIITKAGNVIRIPPGATFKKGRRLCGLDVAQALDEISAN